MREVRERGWKVKKHFFKIQKKILTDEVSCNEESLHRCMCKTEIVLMLSWSELTRMNETGVKSEQCVLNRKNVRNSIL